MAEKGQRGASKICNIRMKKKAAANEQYGPLRLLMKKPRKALSQSFSTTTPHNISSWYVGKDTGLMMTHGNHPVIFGTTQWCSTFERQKRVCRRTYGNIGRNHSVVFPILVCAKRLLGVILQVNVLRPFFQSHWKLRFPSTRVRPINLHKD